MIYNSHAFIRLVLHASGGEGDDSIESSAGAVHTRGSSSSEYRSKVKAGVDSDCVRGYGACRRATLANTADTFHSGSSVLLMVGERQGPASPTFRTYDKMDCILSKAPSPPRQ